MSNRKTVIIIIQWIQITIHIMILMLIINNSQFKEKGTKNNKYINFIIKNYIV